MIKVTLLTQSVHMVTGQFRAASTERENTLSETEKHRNAGALHSFETDGRNVKKKRKREK